MKYDSIAQAIADVSKDRCIMLLDERDKKRVACIVSSGTHANAARIEQLFRLSNEPVAVAINTKIADELFLPHENQDTCACFQFNNKNNGSKDLQTSEQTPSDVMSVITKILNRNSFKREPGEFAHRSVQVVKEGGVIARNGLEEAAVDLLLYAGLPPVAVVAKIAVPDELMLDRNQLEILGGQQPITIISVGDLVVYRMQHEQILQQGAQSHLPTKYGLFEIHVLKSKFNNAECIVLSAGDISKKEEILVRIHSECFTGDALGSLRCDCGDQLHQSLQLISSARAGLLIYLKQEGRGIGLMNKIKAYHLQDQGYDTIAANVKLGFAADLREYGMAYQVLRFFGIESIDLITNNPDKIQQLRQFGLNIRKRIPLEIPPQEYSKQYLETKKYKLGHLLSHI